MKNQALSYVRDEVETVERLLSQSQGETEDIRQTLQMLTDHLSTL